MGNAVQYRVFMGKSESSLFVDLHLKNLFCRGLGVVKNIFVHNSIIFQSVTDYLIYIFIS